jgi:hypothetical protein
MDTPFEDEGAAESHTPLRRFSPIFPVRDLRRALAHYASLGFEVTPYADGDGYGFADRDGVSLHLSVKAGHDPEGEHDHEHVAGEGDAKHATVRKIKNFVNPERIRADAANPSPRRPGGQGERRRSRVRARRRPPTGGSARGGSHESAHAAAR